MSPFAKTCVVEVMLLAALAAPILVAGCERQADPPIDPRAAAGAMAPAAAAPVRVALAADDRALAARVAAALRADDDVAGAAIAVDAQNGRVTLRGELAHEAQVARALALARDVDGVAAVVNLLSTPSSRRSL